MTQKNIGSMISASVNLGLGYADRLLGDIPEDNFSSFARVGDQVIESNHPAFICGHLVLYPSRILSDLGCDVGSAAAPDGYTSLFSKDAKCQDDPDCKLYPGKDELVSLLVESHKRVAAALTEAGDELFSVENPNEAMRGKFPTKGAMHMFYVGGHFMMHMGQLSAWRRASGLGPA